MPTILNENGLRVVIWTNEANHDLPHVHVFCGDGCVTVGLGGSETPPEILVRSNGMKRSEVRRAWETVVEHQEEFLECWRRIHG